MKEVVERRGHSYSTVFGDGNKCLQMCKNCFKVFENLYKKLNSVKEKLAKAASKACNSAVSSSLPTSVNLATPSRRPIVTENQDQSDLASPSAQVSMSKISYYF